MTLLDAVMLHTLLKPQEEPLCWQFAYLIVICIYMIYIDHGDVSRFVSMLVSNCQQSVSIGATCSLTDCHDADVAALTGSNSVACAMLKAVAVLGSRTLNGPKA